MGDDCHEVRGFHGTLPANCYAICQDGLDPRLSGTNATTYGQGSYVARYPSYSHKFADQFRNAEGFTQVFMVRILVGRSCQGSADMRVPPRINNDERNKRYDSTVDNLNNPYIYVIYEPAQAYTECIITYKKDKQRVSENLFA